ncbi:c-type cytochrome [Verrucomicrobium spinosum]|uniref:c-type cytochrome n=2 Tax=Verrucomicrobium spinosum TaxID=2736 RepID=UPI00017468C3|nr:c-type cytochrome [Verrucomicrobium spinosum]
MLLLRYLTPLALCLVLVGKSAAHPGQADPVEYPFVAGFDRFYSAEDDEDHLAQGGMLLLQEFNCTGCHVAPKGWEDRLETRPKVALDGVGSRLSADELWFFIRSPQHRKKGTLMPGLFAGEDRDPKVVEALTVYLSSLKKEPKKFPQGDVERGRQLYHTIGCVACHEPAALTDYKPIEAPPGLDVEKPGLPSVPLLLADKYDFHALAAFLQDPLSIRHAGRMPATELSDQESADVAAYLQLNREPSNTMERTLLALPPQTPEEGRKQFVAQGCTACHDAGKVEPLPRVKPLKEVRVTEGCLSTTKKAGIPDYGMSDLQRRALLLALKEVQGTAPQPRSTLQTVDAFLMKMNCYACHEWRGTGGLEEPRAQYLTVYEAAAHSLGELGRLPPKLDVAGRKLTDEWFAKLLWGTGGGVRSYMTTRMPRFGQDNCVGFLPALKESAKSEKPVAIDTSGLLKHHRSELGRGLMGVGTGGLGCVSCHGLKDRKSLGVPVINLTHTVHRLTPEYFKELLLNPQVTQPGTLMPPLFMGRKKADQEIEQLWTYLKELDQSRLPEGLLQTGDYEIKPEKSVRPVVFRTFLEGAGMQAVTVGSPKGVHAAFDALEMHWAVVWKGRFIDAMTTWEERAMTPAKPLGTLGPVLPPRMPLARLKSASDGWPEAVGEAAGYHYSGYRLDKDGTPIFLYEVGGLKVEDSMSSAPKGDGLLRKIKITGASDAVAEGWYYLGLGKAAQPESVSLTKGMVEFEEYIKF